MLFTGPPRMGVCRIFHFVMPGFSNFHRTKIMSNFKRNLLSELFVLKKIMSEEPPGGGSSRNAWRIGKLSLPRNPPNLLNSNLPPIAGSFTAEKLPGLLGPGFVRAEALGSSEIGRKKRRVIHDPAPTSRWWPILEGCIVPAGYTRLQAE